MIRTAVALGIAGLAWWLSEAAQAALGLEALGLVFRFALVLLALTVVAWLDPPPPAHDSGA